MRKLISSQVRANISVRESVSVRASTPTAILPHAKFLSAASEDRRHERRGNTALNRRAASQTGGGKIIQVQESRCFRPEPVLATIPSHTFPASVFTQVHVQNSFVLDARSHGKVILWSVLPPPLTCAVATTMCRVCKSPGTTGDPDVSRSLCSATTRSRRSSASCCVSG